jgi:mono/diheme cytochrome c family protein
MNGLRKWFADRGWAARGIVAAVAVIAVIAIAALVWIVGPGPMAFAGGSKVSLSNYRAADPTGVPAQLLGESPVKRGEYLARAADCMVCHTTQSGEAYAGGLAFPLPFGTLYSTNITPDKDTGIGNYSDQDFLNALHRGTRPDGSHLYPAMPFTSYTYMTDADALAIKAYLFSLAPVHATAASNTLTFPFNQRWLMVFWSWMFNADSRFEPNADRSPEWNRGAYIAEALGHCGECHTSRNLAFALNNRKKFGGAETAGWYAYNITADQGTGVGAWRDDELLSYLSIGHAAGHGTASGPMGEAVDHSLGQMAPQDIRALVTYLRSVPAIASPDEPAVRAGPAPDSHKDGGNTTDARGKMVFEGACAGCHGWSGVSPISPFATLTGARAVNDPKATNVAQIVISGTKRHIPQGVVSMPAFGNTHSDAEIAAVSNYVVARFGGKKSIITEQDVASLRKQTAR